MASIYCSTFPQTIPTHTEVWKLIWASILPSLLPQHSCLSLPLPECLWTSAPSRHGANWWLHWGSLECVALWVRLFCNPSIRFWTWQPHTARQYVVCWSCYACATLSQDLICGDQTMSAQARCFLDSSWTLSEPCSFSSQHSALFSQVASS